MRLALQPLQTPESVRFVGPMEQFAMLTSGLETIAAGAIVARADGTPYAFTPNEIKDATDIWNEYSPHAVDNQGFNFERRVPLHVGLMAVRGVERAYGLLQQNRTASGDPTNSPLREREVALRHLLGDLSLLVELAHQ